MNYSSPFPIFLYPVHSSILSHPTCTLQLKWKIKMEDYISKFMSLEIKQTSIHNSICFVTHLRCILCHMNFWYVPLIEVLDVYTICHLLYYLSFLHFNHLYCFCFLYYCHHIHLLTSCMWPILLFGCLCWVINNAVVNKMEVMVMRFWEECR